MLILCKEVMTLLPIQSPIWFFIISERKVIMAVIYYKCFMFKQEACAVGMRASMTDVDSCITAYRYSNFFNRNLLIA